MKQISQNYKSGNIELMSVNLPVLKSGGVLVQTHYSVISAGTEGMKVKEGKMSYLGKAKARPDQVKKVLQSVKQQGLTATYHKVMNKLDSLTPLGYSASGVVIAVGDGAEEFRVGQRVACAGVGYANHAEINFVPKNLVIPIPDNVAMEHAAFATIGSIAMQGLRQAEMQLGENACVIGLGLLGQLLVPLLKTAGVNVIGIDLVTKRCELAKKRGASLALKADDPSLRAVVNQFTRGVGVDCVFITAGGNNNGPIELAVEVARDRARVVDIGKTKLDLSWNDFYLKELDLRFSRSYGPGRYDPNYEERGMDYPIGYVRWTERRNMEAFLDLVSSGRIDIASIIDSIRQFSEAEEVYQEIAEGLAPGLGLVFQHSERISHDKILPNIRFETENKHGLETISRGAIRIGMIGAGNYASSMLLPELVKNKSVTLQEVATTTGLSAANAAHKFNFVRTSTDYKHLLHSEDIDAVLIATQHDSHAQIVADSLLEGKTVYVEKPLAINLKQLECVRKAIEESGNHKIMVGFNRRFSPLIGKINGLINSDISPLVIHYRVHAGRLESGSWYSDVTKHGSRFVGEAGHFFDLFSCLTQSEPVSVIARCLRPQTPSQDNLENIAVTVEYKNGSVGNLLYLTQGGEKVPKEFIEIFGGDKTIQLHNFEHLIVYEGDNHKKIKANGVDKGQREEMKRFIDAVQSDSPMPIAFDSLYNTTLATLACMESLRTGQCVDLLEYRSSWQHE